MGAKQSLPTIGENDIDASIKVVEIMDKLDTIHKTSPLPFWNAYQNWLHSLKLYFQLLDSSKTNRNAKNIGNVYKDAKKFIMDGMRPIANPKDGRPPGVADYNNELYKSLINYSTFLMRPITMKTYRDYFMQKAGIINMPEPPKQDPEWMALKARLDTLRQAGGRRRMTHKALRRRSTTRRRS